MYNIELTNAVKRDIAETFNYISQTLYNESAARNLLVEIEKKISSLQNFPESFPLVRDEILASYGMRVLRIKNYLLVYQVIEKTVFILRFLYGRRNWQDIIKTDL